MNQDNQQLKQLVQDTYTSGDLTLYNKFSELLTQLKTLGVGTDKLVGFLEKRLTEDAMMALTVEVFSKFTEDDLQNLERAFNTGLNENQQRALVLELYSKKSGRTLEEYALDMYEQMATTVVKDLSKYLTMLNRVQTFSDEKADEIINMVKEGRYEEAIQKFENSDADNSQSPSGGSITEENIKTVISLLSEGKVEEAKRLLNQ